jgi:hypothetical protein
MRNRIAGGIAVLAGLGIIAKGVRYDWTTQTTSFFAHLLIGVIIFLLPGLYYLITGQDQD